MAIKRKADEERGSFDRKAQKRARQAGGRDEKKKRLIFAPRPDWHAADLPRLDTNGATALPPQRVVEKLFEHAKSLLAADNAAYSSSHLSASSSHKFLSTIMSSGTLEDRTSALTLLVQESPLHSMKAFETLLGISRKKNRSQALMALGALKDLLCQGVVLPAQRKLYAFGKQPGLISALQEKGVDWRDGSNLPGGLKDIHLVSWAYEDWLKKSYFEMLRTIESWLGDEVEYSRSRALTFVWELLKDKPEQEENLLRLLVNKLGDTSRKIASRASYLLLQLENTHPAMKLIITTSIEADCLFRPGQSLHAKYYAIVTLNQTILSQNEQAVADRLLQIYFTLFIQLLKPVTQATKQNGVGKVQNGGGKAGKFAAKKRKAAEQVAHSDDQLREKMIAQVLTGINRSFNFADTNDPNFEKQMDAVFRVTHSANFNTAVQALTLIQQISSAKQFGAERFYRTLYESLLDPRLLTSSKQIMYLNLLYKSLKHDVNAKRVQAFVKRLLQITTMHEPPFVCGVLYLILELQQTFPSIRGMVSEPEQDDYDDGEEHFVDAPEDGGVERPASASAAGKAAATAHYDPKKRDPEHAHADRSCLWELLPGARHFHPSVSLFVESLLSAAQQSPAKPDPTQHSLMHFLDRFVYRSARTKQAAASHGSSIMQPMAGSNAADLLFAPGRDDAEGRSGARLVDEAFWRKKVEDVAADEVFFHSYFNKAGYQKRKAAAAAGRTPKSAADASAGDEEDEGEDQIWKAIAASRPEVEGGADEDDDDLSLADLESAYSDGSEGSERGIDLGGDGDGDGDGGQDVDEADGLLLDEDEDSSDAEGLEEAPDLDGADDDDVPDETEQPEEERGGMNADREKRKRKKKLKQLPTFASMEDYAKLIDNDEDEDM